MVNLIEISEIAKDGGIIAGILAAITAVTVVLRKVTSFILKYKNKAFVAMKLATQSIELVEAFDLAIADKRISKEEMEDLRKEFLKVKELYKALKES